MNPLSDKREEEDKKSTKNMEYLLRFMFKRLGASLWIPTLKGE
jgi:hypothetical protein